jgi:CRP-like cAMP-binding protein
MELNPLFEYIAKFTPLTEDEQSLIRSKVKIRKFLKGQFVVQNGDICRYENFVLSGCLKTFYIDNEGQEHIVMFAVDNWWTADLGSFISQAPADFNIQCLENSVLAQIRFEDLQQLYLDIPKLERFFRTIIEKAYVSSQKRVINNFSLPAKERYLKFRDQYPQIEQRVPQYMIASYLGITKEFLSKIRNQLIMGK